MYSIAMTTSSKVSELEAALERLLDDYRDLQASSIAALPGRPSALETLRLIHASHPVVIRGFSPLTPAAEQYDWSTAEVYREVGGEKAVSVAITDDGLADSVRALDDGTSTFVKPFEAKMSISALIERLGQAGSSSTEAHYLQSQDGNIYRSTPHPNGDPPELDMFQAYIQRDVAWMKEAVGTGAEAVNLWIGDSRSTTSLHHDPYENIYHVLAGSKTFTLLSPIEGFWLDQQFHPSSTLRRTSSGSLEPVLDEPPARVPWVSSTAFPDRVRPLRVTIEEGETLFLPAGWWHRVEQKERVEGIVAAVNYWYPAELNPERYAYERFSRRIARQAGKRGVIPVPGDEDESDDDVDQVPEDVWGSDSGSGEEWDPAEWGR